MDLQTLNRRTVVTGLELEESVTGLKLVEMKLANSGITCLNC